uniref:Monoglyceride lipase-like n=1 Tax=Saccoglossus kowalevskii TaxID=10224 RepID=A0ABM0GYM5_SACKO|nr:PREDICTED: monoglyceride lipase-like [Saccoglossus kowalevskii]
MQTGYISIPNAGNLPDNSTPSALCLILHGVGEHCERYDTVAAPLTGSGIMVFAHDHVGHGQSEGIRVDIKDFNIYVRDTIQHVDRITEHYPNLPVFLIGHSMGGTVAILAAMERPDQFTGMVLVAPAVVENPETATTCKVFMARILAYLAPQFEIGKIEPKYISRDPKEVERYATDPLVWHRGMKARWSVQTLEALKQLQENMSEIKVPFLVMQGDKDVLVESVGATLLMERAQSKDKQAQIYPGYYHALQFEPPQDAAIVLRDLTSWIVTRMKQAP